MYFLEVDGVVVIPDTLGTLDLDKMAAYISFTTQESSKYVFIEDMSLALRYYHSFSVYVKHAIRSADRTQIIGNLEKSWVTARASVTSLSVVSVIVEEMVSISRYDVLHECDPIPVHAV